MNPKSKPTDDRSRHKNSDLPVERCKSFRFLLIKIEQIWFRHFIEADDGSKSSFNDTCFRELTL